MIIHRFQHNPVLTRDDVPYPVATVHNVVFTCGAVPEEDGSVKIYWGGADKVMCMGTTTLDALVEHCLNNPREVV